MALSPEIVNDVGHTDVIQLPAAGLSALTQPSFNLSALAQGFPNGNQPNSLTLVDGRRFDYHDHRTINTGQPEIQRLNSEVSKWSHAYHEEVKSHKSALKRKDNDLRTKDAEIQRLNTELSNYTYWYNEELALHNATKLANESDIERLNHLNNYFRWYNEEVKSHGATKKSLKRVKEEKAAEVKTSQRLRNERTDLEQRLSKKKSANANLANEKAGLERRIAVLEAQKCELEQRTRVADAGGSDWYEYAVSLQAILKEHNIPYPD
jgi:chromosome segregation ATPase